MKAELIYVELKTGYNDNGPAWIGKGFYNRTRKTVYFNGQVFKRSKGAAANYVDLETGEEYWISGVKKDGTDRHTVGSGIVMIDKVVVDDYLKLRGLTSLTKGKYEIVALDNTPAKEVSNELENFTADEGDFDDLLQHKEISELTDKEKRDLLAYYDSLDLTSIPKKARKGWIDKTNALRDAIDPLVLFVFMILLGSCQAKTESERKTDDPPIENPVPPPVTDPSLFLKVEMLTNYVRTAETIKPNPKNGIPFDKLDYDKIIAYDFEGSEEPYFNVIDEKGKFIPVVLKQKGLSQKQADKILSALSNNDTYGEETAACFNPHFALVLFKNNRKVTQVSVCLDCNYLISESEIPAETHKKVNAGTDEEYTQFGFTASGEKAIRDLCKELDFLYGQPSDEKK